MVAIERRIAGLEAEAEATGAMNIIRSLADLLQADLHPDEWCWGDDEDSRCVRRLVDLANGPGFGGGAGDGYPSPGARRADDADISLTLPDIDEDPGR